LGVTTSKTSEKVNLGISFVLIVTSGFLLWAVTAGRSPKKKTLKKSWAAEGHIVEPSPLVDVRLLRLWRSLKEIESTRVLGVSIVPSATPCEHELINFCVCLFRAIEYLTSDIARKRCNRIVSDEWPTFRVLKTKDSQANVP
jgi:hypothetical protein